ncbi:hypothetical protein GF382_00705 [Candidatus Falkowbacteria bacterium]|nr:hypothetical protein [Candidatus Falkowbacteria bacterium]
MSNHEVMTGKEIEDFFADLPILEGDFIPEEDEAHLFGDAAFTEEGQEEAELLAAYKQEQAARGQDQARIPEADLC